MQLLNHKNCLINNIGLDALTGFEPVSADPESAVLPLNYKASKTLIILFKNKFFINLKFHLDF